VPFALSNISPKRDEESPGNHYRDVRVGLHMYMYIVCAGGC
jgi:hypothetical protein